MKHILDRPVWSALSTKQSQFAVGGEHCRRFAPDIGPLAGARDDSRESLAELAELVPRDGSLLLLQRDPVVLPDSLVATSREAGVQMIATELDYDADNEVELVRLSDADAPAMVALATLTKPGPFANRTHELGTFWGVKEDGKLVAMAGERMAQEGFTEVSGVCTHPDARGRGLGRALSAAVTERILARGEVAYLHAYASNAAAIKLYESLGFRVRAEMHVATVKRS